MLSKMMWTALLRIAFLETRGIFREALVATARTPISKRDHLLSYVGVKSPGTRKNALLQSRLGFWVEGM
jgi:hypothetical protein